MKYLLRRYLIWRYRRHRSTTVRKLVLELADFEKQLNREREDAKRQQERQERDHERLKSQVELLILERDQLIGICEREKARVAFETANFTAQRENALNVSDRPGNIMHG